MIGLVVTEITLETDKEFVSDKGTPFEIYVTHTGNYAIRMLKGGAAPKICFNKYTSRRMAENELSKYLKNGDRAGYAKYPEKVTDAKSKNK